MRLNIQLIVRSSACGAHVALPGWLVICSFHGSFFFLQCLGQHGPHYESLLSMACHHNIMFINWRSFNSPVSIEHVLQVAYICMVYYVRPSSQLTFHTTIHTLYIYTIHAYTYVFVLWDHEDEGLNIPVIYRWIIRSWSRLWAILE